MPGAIPMVKDEFFVLNSTGPGLISRTLAENPDAAKTVTVLFPDDVCDFRNWNKFGDIGIHLMGSTWREKKGFLYNKAARYWEYWKVDRIVKQGRKLGAKRIHARPV